VHDALHRLYAGRPSRSDISGWSDDELRRRCLRAATAAFAQHARNADKMLGELLTLELQRTVSLLHEVVAIDRERSDFVVDDAERGVAAQIGAVRLQLRCDRIDRLPDDSVLILDYKTGLPKKFLVYGEARDLQLVVYACAVSQAVAGLGLFNVDARASGIDGAGPALGDDDDWNERLQRWIGEVQHLAQQIASGDVRVNLQRGVTDARPLALLSRFAEVQRDN
jgi:hypothetical protein